MKDRQLAIIREMLKKHPELAGYAAYSHCDRIHLRCNWGDFARLRHLPGENRWKMDFYLNRERWRRYDFTGTLEECLELLNEAPHYLFWEG
ncbi:DUF3024 domain-containing protein [Syntrophotalea acetylenica]|uniref:DUF3024 domain-containing protein n=1 Tax=Syntrophotalea acetylenica TaxID=29542 RepID=A0A1L3GDP8_SYNAC|nr:hypothetical protein [Syntrophotalea acetylenica]APG23828.1 hypothetical protein A7E75_01415 [Syntrophotalea acetylenica]APG44411.1 hypothetical protein A6070_10030 [Syntrophotalea acetylenica]MDY0261588.1 hypothetical protein [Syntrophotalea acetylenica]